jgi:hypothetical protein
MKERKGKTIFTKKGKEYITTIFTNDKSKIKTSVEEK